MGVRKTSSPDPGAPVGVQFVATDQVPVTGLGWFHVRVIAETGEVVAKAIKRLHARQPNKPDRIKLDINHRSKNCAKTSDLDVPKGEESGLVTLSAPPEVDHPPVKSLPHKGDLTPPERESYIPMVPPFSTVTDVTALIAVVVIATDPAVPPEK